MKRLIKTQSRIFMHSMMLLVALFAIGFLMSGNFSANAQNANRDADVDPYDAQEPQGRYRTQKSPYCRELESKLAADWVRGNRSGSLLPELNQKIRKQDALFNKLQNKADRMNCYENMFIFGRTLRRTKKCHAIDRKIRTAKRELQRLRDERESIRDASRDGNRRNRIIQELARNDCGDQYRYEARRSSSNNWFEDSGLGGLFGGGPVRRRRPRDENASTIQPYATYRTMCVRLCDGYYFPVSFSTLPSNFANDSEVCQSKCAAPAELYVYRNPGGEVEQMITPDGRPYDSIENAWRYRKEYIKGCSCKESEYSQAEIDKNKEVQKPDGKPSVPLKQAANKKAPAPQKSSSGKARSIEDLIR